MSNQVQFNTFNFHSSAVRVIIDSTGELWFCGTDVCDVLGYANAPDTLKKHCKQGGIAKRYTPTTSGNQEMIFINEPNLYRLIIKSRKPEAERFEAWVFEEVLPQIRKTGQYRVEYKTQPSDTLTKEQQSEIRTLVLSNAAKLPKEQQKVAIVQAWSKLKAHFKVSYRQIPQSEFSEAISIVQRTFTEWELVDDEPLAITQNKDTFTLTQDQASDVIWVFAMACFMNETIRYLEKPLRLLGNSRAGTLYSQGFEYRQALLRNFPLFERMLSQFPPEGGKHHPIYGYTGDWDRLHLQVIPNVRQALE